LVPPLCLRGPDLSLTSDAYQTFLVIGDHPQADGSEDVSRPFLVRLLPLFQFFAPALRFSMSVGSYAAPDKDMPDRNRFDLRRWMSVSMLDGKSKSSLRAFVGHALKWFWTLWDDFGDNPSARALEPLAIGAHLAGLADPTNLTVVEFAQAQDLLFDIYRTITVTHNLMAGPTQILDPRQRPVHTKRVYFVAWVIREKERAKKNQIGWGGAFGQDGQGWKFKGETAKKAKLRPRDLMNVKFICYALKDPPSSVET
jgi:hypothetical protein